MVKCSFSPFHSYFQLAMKGLKTLGLNQNGGTSSFLNIEVVFTQVEMNTTKNRMLCKICRHFFDVGLCGNCLCRRIANKQQLKTRMKNSKCAQIVFQPPSGFVIFQWIIQKRQPYFLYYPNNSKLLLVSFSMVVFTVITECWLGLFDLSLCVLR